MSATNSTYDDTPQHRPVADRLASVAFCTGLVTVGFLLGTFVMFREAPPAGTLRQAYQGGLALYDKTTRYQDPLDTDLWREARTQARGVTVHDPSAAQEGVTLYSSGHDQRAFLIDMNGKVLHEWAAPFSALWDKSASVKAPKGDAYIYIEKAQVLPNGDLLALYTAVGDTPWGYGIARLDADSNVIWKYLAHAHHDFAVDEAGNIHVLTQEISSRPLPGGFDYLRPPRIDDFVVTLAPDGRELRKVWVTGALSASPAGRRLNLVPWYVREGSGDYLHTNSIKILKEPLPGVPGSRAGQALLSFREISTVGLLDLDAERVVWALSGSWLRQHDADVLPGGHILLFDNEGDQSGFGASRVLEIEPETQAIVWRYSGTAEAPLESIVRSSQDRLANGNTLIVESDAGRVLEVTREGRIVWEFVNPVRGGENDSRIPIIFWVQRLDPERDLEPGFRARLAMS
jgi:hypothetical protein